MERRRAVYPACTEPSREPGTRGCGWAFAHIPVLRLTDRGRVHPDPRQDAADPAPSFGTFSGLRGAALLTSTPGPGCGQAVSSTKSSPARGKVGELRT